GSSCSGARSRCLRAGSPPSSTSRKTCGKCLRGRSAASGSRVSKLSNPQTRWRRSVSSGKKSKPGVTWLNPHEIGGFAEISRAPQVNSAEVVMTSYRADQVGEQVREEIMSIIRRELKDPRIGFVSITAVRMSPDLRNARVRVSVLGNPEQQKESMAGLVSARGLIRHELGRRLQNLKFSPELRFELDSSIEYAVHISE